MAFLKLLTTAAQLEKLKKELTEEKVDALNVSKNLPSKKSHYIIKMRLKMNRLMKKTLACCFFEKFCYTLRHDGSCENYTVKSIIGFTSGFILTYIFFMFFVFQLNISIQAATVFCSIMGCILMIGLAFSTKVRCVVLLTLPQFFSQKGRQALLAYAFILATTGPARNTLNNLGILSESLACGQEQLKQAIRQIIDVIKKPFLAIKEAIKKVVKTVKEIVKKIKEILLTIKRIIMAIVKVIKAAFQFLASIISICNKELGTPFERCTRVFENAIADCNAKLGPLFNWLCSLTYIVQSVCYLVKVLDLICIIVDFINDSVIGVVIRKVKSFIRHIRTMFYVRIKFHHSFQFQTNTSKTIDQIAQSMVAEIKDRTATLRAIFKFMTSAAMLFFMFIIFKVLYYRYRFLTSERFDNKYINKDFRQIDIRRAKLGKETVLPLNDREAKHYVSVSSRSLAKSEKKAMSKAVSTLATASMKLAIIIVSDYCLYWMMNLIKYYGKFQSKVQAPNIPTVYIAGTGFLADLLRSIVKAFQPVGIQLEIDTVPCLPTPIPPNYDRYVQIATVIVLCWVLTLLEPYGLRLRHIVMCYYHPIRAKQRAIWLYNHIMRARNSFLKFARRQLRRKVMGDSGIAKITCKEYLAANFKICRLCLGEKLQTCCLLCGEVFRESDSKKPIKCQTPDCPGIYCEQCFSDLQNLCTVCLSPIEYGDLSDISEEKDSSEEEAKLIIPKEKKRGKWRKFFICSVCCRKCCPENDDEEKDGSERKPLDKSNSDTSSDEESRLLKDKIDQLSTDAKIKDLDKMKDSDYYSSDVSTDYSYSYQYEKNKELRDAPETTTFKDVEQQKIPDYASMSSFREEYDTDLGQTVLDRTVLQQSVWTAVSGVTLEQCKKGRKVDFAGVTEPRTTSRKKKRKKRKTKSEEERPLLDGSYAYSTSESDDNDRLKHFSSPVLEALKSSSSITDDDEIFISPGKQRRSLVEDIGIETIHRTGYTQTSPPELNISATQSELVPEVSVSSTSPDSDLNYHKFINVVIPEFDFSSVNSTPRSTKSYVSDFFSNVNYEEVSESPKSSSSSNDKGVEDNKTKIYKAVSTNTDFKTEIGNTIFTKIEEEIGNSSKSESKYKTDESEIATKSHVDRVDVGVSALTSSKVDANVRDSSTSKSKSGVDLETLKSTKIEDTDVEYFNIMTVKVEIGDSAKPEDSYKFEQKQRKKVNQYYKAVKGMLSEKPTEKKKPGKFMRFFQKIIPKRKKNPNALPLYRDPHKEETELKKKNTPRDHWDSSSSTSLNSALIRQRSAAWENDISSEDIEEEADRFRGGTSGGIRHFQKALTRCDSEATTSSRKGTTNNTSPSRSHSEAKQVLAKYFLSIEDLTPTRDCDIPMTTIDPQNTCYCPPTEVFLREILPVRDAEEGATASILIQTECSQTGPSIQPSSSSNLSEAFCSSVLGVPCAIQDFSTKTDYSFESVLCAIKGESLIIPVEPEEILTKDHTEEDSIEPIDCCKKKTESKGQQCVLKNNRQKLCTCLKDNCTCTFRDKRQRLCTCLKDNCTCTFRDNIQKLCGCLKENCTCTFRDNKQRLCTCLKEVCTCTFKDNRKKHSRSKSGPSRTFKDCNCESIVQCDCKTQTCPTSILKKCPIQKPICVMESLVNKTVETAERYPVRDSTLVSRCSITRDKMQQTSENCLDKPVDLEECMESSQFSQSSRSYCNCGNQCAYGCCKCPPPPVPRFDDFVNLREMDYGRRSCPGCIDKCSSYPQEFPSEYTLRSCHKPPYFPRRYSMEYPSDGGYSQYRDPYSSECSYPERQKPRQKMETVINTSACKGDCRCCAKKRKPKPVSQSQYRCVKYESSSSSESEDENNCYHERYDLPYQNGEDYMDLVQELEETLQSRNRNRVRRAMQEFEKRSKYNKPLEKPIIDYDQTSESEEPLIQKISQLTSDKQRCCAGDLCNCRRESRAKSSHDKRSEHKQRMKIKTQVSCRPPQERQCEGQTRWQMDISSGEWYKVSGNQQRFKGCRRSRTPSPHRECPRDCSCCASKRYDYR